MSWDYMTESAGSRSVALGRACQRQVRGSDLAISEEGWLLASVTGGEHYEVTVWCNPERKKDGVLNSRCTCPVGADSCKHAVAVVAEYLELVGKDAEVPAADPEDDRWATLSGDGPEDDEDDEDDDEADAL